jgi:hypothetical protein
MEVVGIQPIYVPGSPLDHSELCVSRCGFLTYSLCSTKINGGKCKPKESYFYFYDLTQDRLVKYSVADLHAAAAATDDAQAGSAEDHDYLVIRVHLFQTKTPYAMAKDSIGIYSSVPTVLTSASTLRMDVNTQGRFYGGALLENPDGIVPLSHMFVTDIESPRMDFLTKAEVTGGTNLFTAAINAKKSTVVFRLDQVVNRRMPAFLPITLTNYGFEKSGLLFDSAQTTELENKFALGATETAGCNVALLSKLAFKKPAGAAPSIADIDLKTGRFNNPVIMYRDYSGSVLVDGANGKVTDEVNSEAPYGRVVNGLGKILTGDAQADSKVHQGSLSPLQALFLRSM